MQAPSVRAAVDAARIDADFSMVAGLDAPPSPRCSTRGARRRPGILLVITPTGRRAESIGAALESSRMPRCGTPRGRRCRTSG
jgi:transcription-repair coupling factor (superfamily II helicase)